MAERGGVYLPKRRPAEHRRTSQPLPCSRASYARVSTHRAGPVRAGHWPRERTKKRY